MELHMWSQDPSNDEGANALQFPKWLRKKPLPNCSNKEQSEVD